MQATKTPRTAQELYEVSRALEHAHDACENVLYKGAAEEEADYVKQASALLQKALESLRKKHNVG